MSVVDYPFKDFPEVIKPFVSEVHVDVLGNIIAHKSGVGKCIMLIAHHDVVRLMISHIDENGFLYMKPAGGIDVSILPARKVIIMRRVRTLKRSRIIPLSRLDMRPLRPKVKIPRRVWPFAMSDSSSIELM